VSEGRSVSEEPSPADDPEDRHELVRLVSRIALLSFWSLVVWGTLYAGVFAFGVLSEGPSRALARTARAPGWMPDYVNLTVSAVAVVVWVLAGVLVWRRRRGATAVSEESEDQSHLE
jgi:hypothetical protein